MRKLLNAAVTATLVAAGVVLTPVAAHANHASVDCRMVAVSGETITGQDNAFTGYAVGYVISNNSSEPVSIECHVFVDGVGSYDITPTGTGVGSAVTYKQVNFPAPRGSTVELCAVWTAGLESDSRCFPSVVDREIAYDDLIGQALVPTRPLVAGILCPLLVTVDDTVDVRGAIDIEDGEGDVRVLGNLIYDCPPFETSGDLTPGDYVRVIVV